MQNQTFILNNKCKIPKVGLGTFTVKEYDILKATIKNAIEIGYRHIDTAFCYDNEKILGKILQEIFSEGKIKREDLFITTKFWNTQRDPVKGLKDSLRNLQLDYVDLYLIHFPVMFLLDDKGSTIKDEEGFNKTEEFKVNEIWKRMEELVDKNLAKSIGVSNFGIKTLKKLLSQCKIKPVMNQIELHPYLQQKEVFDFCMKNDIRITAFSSLGGKAFRNEESPVITDDKIIKKIADKYKVSPSRIILSWLVQKGCCIIPKSTNVNHLRDNFELIELKNEEMEEINGIKTIYRFNDPPAFRKEIYE